MSIAGTPAAPPPLAAAAFALRRRLGPDRGLGMRHARPLEVALAGEPLLVSIDQGREVDEADPDEDGRSADHGGQDEDEVELEEGAHPDDAEHAQRRPEQPLKI